MSSSLSDLKLLQDLGFNFTTSSMDSKMAYEQETAILCSSCLDNIKRILNLKLKKKGINDQWIISGLTYFIYSVFIRSYLGHNEFIYSLQTDMLNLQGINHLNLEPLYSPKPPQTTKAFITLYMLNKLIDNKLLLALKYIIKENIVLISTRHFIKICSTISKKPLKDILNFSNQYIYNHGLPFLAFNWTFNRKKMTIDFDVVQKNPSIANSLINPMNQETKKFTVVFITTGTFNNQSS